MRVIDEGRLGVIRKLSNGGFGLNIGSGFAIFENKINVDITSTKALPEVIGSAVQLPFRSGICDEVIFSDVIEHLPKGAEVVALSEIRRVLKPGGKIFLSTPSSKFLFKILDPALWLQGHRHYSEEQIKKFIEDAGFKSCRTLFAGKVPFGVVTFTYAMNFILRRKKLDLFGTVSKKAFDGVLEKNGGTLYAVAVK